MKRSVGVAGFLAVLWAGDGRAEPFNYEETLVGTRSTALGGAYAASAEDATVMAFNPAGIAALEYGKGFVSISGYAEAAEAAQGQSYLDQDVRILTLDGMLNFAGAVRRFEWGGIGLGFSVPERRTEEGLKRFSSLEYMIPGGGGETRSFPSGSLFLDARTTTYEVGPTLALRIPFARIFIGAQALHSVRRSQISRAYSLREANGDFLALETSFQQLSQALRFGYGLQWHPHRLLRAGASLSHTVPVSDRISVSKLVVDVNQDRLPDLVTQLLGGQMTLEEAVGEVFREDYSESAGEFGRPMLARVGVRLGDTGILAVSVEGTLFTEAIQDLPELPLPFKGARQETVANLHLGAERRIGPDWQVQAGFYTDGNHHRSIDDILPQDIDLEGYDRRTPRDATLVHITAGVTRIQAAGDVSLALNYGWGNGHIIDILGNVRSEKRRKLSLTAGMGLVF